MEKTQYMFIRKRTNENDQFKDIFSLQIPGTFSVSTQKISHAHQKMKTRSEINTMHIYTKSKSVYSDPSNKTNTFIDIRLILIMPPVLLLNLFANHDNYPH